MLIIYLGVCLLCNANLDGQKKLLDLFKSACQNFKIGNQKKKNQHSNK